MSKLFAIFYAYAAWLNRRFPFIVRDGRRFRVLPSVYRCLENEQRLASDLEAGQKVLDMGSGAGLIAVHAALRGAQVTALDINAEAVENTKLNAELHGVAVQSARSDLFEAVPGQRFDRIICAAPYLDIEMPAAEQQWATSPGFVNRLIAQVPAYLADGGCLVLMAPKKKHAAVEQAAQSAGLKLLRCDPPPKWSTRLWLSKLIALQPPIMTRVYVLGR